MERVRLKNMFDKGSRHNRASLPIGEEERLETLNEKILRSLEDGPKTNKQLSRIALDYGRRLRDLRSFGHQISRERIDGGFNLYTLGGKKEPRWLVRVRVTLVDGSVSVQEVLVRGSNVGLAKNRAQHLATRVKILSSKFLGD